jgi:hypothetical protein
MMVLESCIATQSWVNREWGKELSVYLGIFGHRDYVGITDWGRERLKMSMKTLASWSADALSHVLVMHNPGGFVIVQCIWKVFRPLILFPHVVTLQPYSKTGF